MFVVNRVFAVLPVWVPVAVGGAVLLVGATLAVLRYRAWGYEVRDDGIYLERGVFTQVRTVVPFVRIQHVDSSRSPVERLVGLATTVVYTAGSRGADVTVPGLTPVRADDLRERLKRLAIRSEGEDAV
ncbi:MAG: PH domain-containing protein [Haloferacaceae archaeon]